MLGLCEITSCRRQTLLAYFGEVLTEPCGNCDNCLTPVETWDGTEAAQKALSAYRTGQRFGVNHLIDVLRGVLRLAASCRPLLRGDETISLRREEKQKAARQRTRTPLPDDIDVALWEALRDRRRELAEEQGVPPYVVFADRTLQAMCAQLPRDLASFATLPGVGERKLDKYGAEFLAVIEAHREAAV
jgi:ATP-dependent DNA helicase RecQ